MNSDANNLFSTVYYHCNKNHVSQQEANKLMEQEAKDNKIKSYAKLTALLRELELFKDKLTKNNELIVVDSGNLNLTNSLAIKLNRQGKVIPFIVISLFLNSITEAWTLIVKDTVISASESYTIFIDKLVKVLACELKPSI